MKECTIISYPSSKGSSLLSLTDTRSLYMVPFGGKFRIVDFTLRNTLLSGAKKTIIYNKNDDGLEEYVNRYGPFSEEAPPVKVVSNEFSDLEFCRNLIKESNSRYYIIYNGDNPSIIEFSDIMKKYKKRRNESLLFKIIINGKPSMAYKLLVTSRRSILKVIDKAIKEKRSSPNIFEMIINVMVNRGIKKSSFNAHYWPINNIPDYYFLSRSIIEDPGLFKIVFDGSRIESRINAEGYAVIGEYGKVIRSFLSDYCHINGIVENSIIYPGVEIGKDSYIKDSIVLPFVKIGNGSKVTRCIIDESTEIEPETEYINIGNMCRIGSDEENIKNSDFPDALFSSITLIGKNAKISDHAKIGGACFVASGSGEKYFSEKKFLYDGSSIINDPAPRMYKGKGIN